MKIITRSSMISVLSSGFLLYLLNKSRTGNQQPAQAKMTFRLHLVRHAEGTHNPTHDTTILDPPLTARGIEQSQELCRDFPFKDSVGLVMTSPLRRTLQTARLGFKDTLDKKFYARGVDVGVQNGAELLLEPDIQAHSARPCDTGSDISILRDEFPDLPWDFLSLNPVFPAKEGLYAADREALKLRGVRVQRRLEERFKELKGSNRPDIVVVTHGGFWGRVTGVESTAAGPAKWKTFMVSFDQESRMVVGPSSE
ncbi:histidine phosphatase superfamily [Aspergillus californicus]